MNDFKWSRQSNTDWFEKYRPPYEGGDVPPLAQKVLGYSIPMCVIVTFCLGYIQLRPPEASLYLTALLTAVVALIFALVWIIYDDKLLFACRKQPVKLLLGLPLAAPLILMSGLYLPDIHHPGGYLLAALMLAAGFVIIGDNIFSETAGLRALWANSQMFVCWYIQDIIDCRFSGGLTNEKRTRRLSIIPEIPIPGAPVAARSYEKLRQAINRHRAVCIAFVVSVPVLALCLLYVESRFDFPYWARQIVLLLACFVVFIPAWFIGNPECKQGPQRQDDCDAAVKAWYRIKPNRCWAVLPLVLLATVFVCRTANYFPFPLARAELAASALEQRNYGFADAEQFLSRVPESSILVSLHAVMHAEQDSTRFFHAFSLLFSVFACCLATHVFIETVIQMLVQAAIPDVAHEIDYINTTIDLGIDDDLTENDVKAAVEINTGEEDFAHAFG